MTYEQVVRERAMALLKCMTHFLDTDSCDRDVALITEALHQAQQAEREALVTMVEGEVMRALCEVAMEIRADSGPMTRDAAAATYRFAARIQTVLRALRPEGGT